MHAVSSIAKLTNALSIWNCDDVYDLVSQLYVDLETTSGVLKLLGIGKRTADGSFEINAEFPQPEQPKSGKPPPPLSKQKQAINSCIALWNRLANAQLKEHELFQQQLEQGLFAGVDQRQLLEAGEESDDQPYADNTAGIMSRFDKANRYGDELDPKSKEESSDEEEETEEEGSDGGDSDDDSGGSGKSKKRKKSSDKKKKSRPKKKAKKAGEDEATSSSSSSSKARTKGKGKHSGEIRGVHYTKCSHKHAAHKRNIGTHKSLSSLFCREKYSDCSVLFRSLCIDPTNVLQKFIKSTYHDETVSLMYASISIVLCASLPVSHSPTLPP